MATPTSKSPKRTPRPAGSYALALRLPSRRKIRVGKLGLVEFPRGHYVYFGSALGGLNARVARHLSNDKQLHWHADYLSAEVPWEYAWQLADGQRWECVWACDAMATMGVDVPAPGFGSSDRRCCSHLVRVNTARGMKDLLRGLTPAPRGLRLQSMKSS